MLPEDFHDGPGVFISPGGVKTESDLFFIGIHAVNRKLPGADGAADGDGRGDIENGAGGQNKDSQPQEAIFRYAVKEFFFQELLFRAS